LFFFSVFGGIFVLRKLFLDWVDKQAKKTDNQVDDFLVDIVQSWTQAYVVAVFSAFVATQTYPISNAIDTAAKAGFLGMLTWRVIRSIEMSTNFVMDQWVFEQTEEGKNLSANFHKGLRLCLYTAGAIFILDNCGLNISSLVAGFGIGGLAVALAAQAILGDTIASFTMFIDRPFVVGDAITTGGHTGIVEHIGFKTTRLRAMTGELIIFPNSAVSSSVMKNFSRAEHIGQCIEIGVAVETDDDLVRRIPDILMDALRGQDTYEPCEVYFKNFGTSALTFEIRFLVHSNSPSVIRAANGSVNTIINETCKRENISLPYPTEVVINKNGDA